MGNRISILGCGWYGLPLAKKLVAEGYDVKGSTTTKAKLQVLTDAQIKAYTITLEAGSMNYDSPFFECDVLLIGIPPRSKSPELKSFQQKIDTIITAIERHQIKQVIFISSTGIYQDGNFKVNETISPQPDKEIGRALLRAENSLVERTTFSTTIIRFAGLVGPERNLAKYFAGKENIPNGLAPINLIHLNDCVGITFSILSKKAFGYIYHGVMPSHPSRADFYTAACKACGLETPKFSNELNNGKQVDSINLSTVLNYQFSVHNWQLMVKLLTEN